MEKIVAYQTNFLYYSWKNFFMSNEFLLLFMENCFMSNEFLLIFKYKLGIKYY